MSEQTLEPIRFDEKGKKLLLLNQLLLPHEYKFEEYTTCEGVHEAIATMVVRGAPAIAVAAVLGLAAELLNKHDEWDNSFDVVSWAKDRLVYLETSRPTAVNLHNAVLKFTAFLEGLKEKSKSEVVRSFVEEAKLFHEQDTKDNERISEFGSEFVRKMLEERGVEPPFTVLTHCNTGALATTKYGTALGVIRFLHKKGLLKRVYATETRPYNQGARLTVFECVYEKIPVTLVADSAVSTLLKNKGVDFCVVGADRVCRNGDTANKIGTYQISLSCDYHRVPFFIAAPSTSIDLTLQSGDGIVIEERSANELLYQQGKRVVAEGCATWNPSFDTAPSKLIAGIITEKGVATKEKGAEEFDLEKFLL